MKQGGWLNGKLSRNHNVPQGRGICRRLRGAEGVSVRVSSLRCCDGMRSRLCALGFTPGAEIIVYKGENAGCRVQVRDTCVALDYDSAESILCDAGSGVATIRALCAGTGAE